MGAVLLLDAGLEPCRSLKLKDKDLIMERVQRLERQTFPKLETMDFGHEMKKRNTVLAVVVDDLRMGEGDAVPRVLAYLLHSRSGTSATVHKLCVAETARRRGMGRCLLTRLKSDLRNQGCSNVQLWVDVERLPARALYASLDFEVTGQLSDYYSPGRHAVRMKACLT